MNDYTPAQRRLMQLRDERCGGNAAELARRIGKDATYVNRLFYPASKAGHKGIGLEIMAACTAAFDLPPGWWEESGEAVERIKSAWPFQTIPIERFLALPDKQQGWVEGKLDHLIEQCEALVSESDEAVLRRKTVRKDRDVDEGSAGIP